MQSTIISRMYMKNTRKMKLDGEAHFLSYINVSYIDI